MAEIVGDRVFLRAMTRAEFHQARRAYVPDPVMDPNPYAYDPEQADARYDTMCAQESWYKTVGIFAKNGALLGELSFKRIDRERGRCEIGIALSHDGVKGRGYGGEAFALAVSHAFDTLGLRAVYADTMGSNRRMQRILRGLGFRLFARHAACYDMKDRWEDRLDYVLWKEEVRPATAEDLPALRLLIAEAGGAAGAPEDPPFTDGARAWCCYHKGRLAGVIALFDRAHIELLFVRKHFRRQGVARALLCAALGECGPDPLPEITAYASPCALAAFRRLGFVKAGPERERDGLRLTPMRLSPQGYGGILP